MQFFRHWCQLQRGCEISCERTWARIKLDVSIARKVDYFSSLRPRLEETNGQCNGSILSHTDLFFLFFFYLLNSSLWSYRQNQPFFIKTWTISLFPCKPAKCKGLFSSTVRAFISALCSMNLSQSSRFPLTQARWNGVTPLWSGQLTGASAWLRRSLEVFTQPRRAAKCNGVA